MFWRKTMKTQNKIYPYYDAPLINDLRELVDYCTNTHGYKIAFHWLENKEEKTKTYSEFNDDITALGEYFINEGYRGKHIAVIGENSYNWIVTYFAAVNSGNVIVPIDKECTKEDVKYFIEKGDAEVFVHSDDYKEEAEFSGCPQLINMMNFDEILAKGRGLLASGKTEFKELEINRNVMCTLVFTSGTTAEPKGVMLSQRNLGTNSISVVKSVKLPDTALLMLPLNHTYGVIATTSAMVSGCKIFINSSLRRLADDVKYAKPKYIPTVPLVGEVFYKNIWSAVRASGKEGLIKKMIPISNVLRKMGIDIRRKIFKQIIDGLGGNLELIVTGGAPNHEESITGLTNFGIQVVACYGISECSPSVSSMRNEHYDPTSVGNALYNVEIKLSEENEIMVNGTGVFLGYYKNPEATQAAMEDGWFKTGDIGELRDGFLYVTGRMKNLIVLSNGKNVSPEELEKEIIKNVSDINEVIVYANGDEIIAEIYAAGASDDIKETIKNGVFALNRNLPAYKHIANVVFRNNEFEKTTTKKIKRTRRG